MARIPLALLLALLVVACDPGTGPDGTDTPGETTIAMSTVRNLPRAGGDVTGIAITADNRIVAAIGGELHLLDGAGALVETINADPVHGAIGLAPSGRLYAVADTSFRAYDLDTRTYRSARIDPSGPFATNGRIESAAVRFSPSGEPFVVLISNYPRTYVYHSSDEGMTWQSLPLPPGFAYGGDLTFLAGGDIAMSGSFGFYITSDRGATWSALPPARAGYGGALMTAANGDVYHNIPGGGGLMVSRNRGASFTELTPFNRAPFIFALEQGSDGALYALAANSGTPNSTIIPPMTLSRSSDGGTTWVPMAYAQARVLALRGSMIALGLGAQGYAPNLRGGGVMVSQNAGATWTPNGMAVVEGLNAIALDRDGRLLALSGGTLYRRTPTGAWQMLAQQSGNFHRLATTPAGAILLTSTTSSYVSLDDGRSWIESTYPDYTPGSGAPTVASIAGLPNGDFLVAITEYSDANGHTNGHLYRIGSDGRPVRIRGVVATLSQLSVDPDGIVYGSESRLDPFSQTYSGTTYRSIDNGATWAPLPSSERATAALATNSQRSMLLAGELGTYRFRSRSGDERIVKFEGMSTQPHLVRSAFFDRDDRLYMLTLGDGLFISDAPVR